MLAGAKIILVKFLNQFTTWNKIIKEEEMGVIFVFNNFRHVQGPTGGCNWHLSRFNNVGQCRTILRVCCGYVGCVSVY